MQLLRNPVGCDYSDDGHDNLRLTKSIPSLPPIGADQRGAMSISPTEEPYKRFCIFGFVASAFGAGKSPRMPLASASSWTRRYSASVGVATCRTLQ